jgi:hypothetical protein
VDVTSSSTNWIFAAKSGSALNSDSTSASISQHGGTYGTMKIDLSKAQNSANTNPFTSAASTGSTGSTGTTNCDGSASGQSGGSSSGASPTTTGGGFFGGFGGSFPTSSDDNSGRGRPPWATGSSNDKRATTTSACTPNGGTTGSGGLNQFGSFSVEARDRMTKAHAILACLAFAVLFPFGAISIRLLSFPGLVAFHAALQILGYLTYIIAFGLGVYLATQMHYVSYMKPCHFA